MRWPFEPPDPNEEEAYTTSLVCMLIGTQDASSVNHRAAVTRGHMSRAKSKPQLLSDSFRSRGYTCIQAMRYFRSSVGRGFE